MDSKDQIEQIMKRRFFVTQTGYPAQNGFLDLGPVLTAIKQNIIYEYKKVFLDENTYEIEPSAVLPYNVLKNSGHIDRFCDVILSDGTNIVRADHYIEDKIGEILNLPKDLLSNYESIFSKVTELKINLIEEKVTKIKHSKSATLSAKEIEITQFNDQDVENILSNFECEKKALQDLNKLEIDFVVLLHNLYSPVGLPFRKSEDFNLIFKLNDRQFLRPELAQSQFTNFRRLYEMNNEKLPFSSMCIGRSYRNEISARGGMLRTKEFEQAEIEYFTEDGSHYGFESVRDVKLAILPNTRLDTYVTTVGEAFDNGVISSQAICFYLAKAQEFCLNIGIKLENLRYRQHNKNEMAHYANDCWDVEIKTLTGWVECAGIADRSNFDLSVHAQNVNTSVKKLVEMKKVYDVIINKKDLGKRLKTKMQEFEAMVMSLDQMHITENMKDNKIAIKFEDEVYECQVESRNSDCEFFIPNVIEPSFGISRVLYALVEQSFNLRDERNVLSLKPKMCYLHCVIGFLKYLDEFEPLYKQLIRDLADEEIRYKTTERSCSIGKKYSYFDEIGVPFFVTFDFNTAENKTVTIRERDSTSQIRVPISEVAGIIKSLIKEKVTWSELFEKFKI